MIARMFCLSAAVLLLQPVAVGAQTPYRLTEEQRLGAADAPLSLVVPGSIFVATDGSVVVTQPSSATVHMFDDDGQATLTLGPAVGPVTFERPMSAGLRGDTVWVVDPARYLIAFFGRNGELLHSHSWRRPDVTPWRPVGSALRFQKADVATDGDFTVDAVRPFPITLHDTAGAAVDTIAFIDVGRSAVTIEGRRIASPLHDGPLTTFSPSGDRLVIVNRRVPVRGEAPTFTITWIETATRDTLQSATFRYTPRPIFEPYIDAQPSDELRAALRAQAWMPPITALIASDDDSVWAARERVPRTPRRWYHFAADGRAVGYIDLPNRSQIAAAHDDHVWVIERGEGDAAHVVRYRIQH